LAREASSALRGAEQLAQIAAERALRVEGFQRHQRVAEDDGEEVVDIVGDPSGEPPHGLHRLRVLQLPPETPLAGDVAEKRDASRDRELVVEKRSRLDHESAQVTIPAIDDELRLRQRLALCRATERIALGGRAS